jgi:hypothetical protein
MEYAGLSVRCITEASPLLLVFSQQAPAALRMALIQVYGSDSGAPTAVADTRPERSWAWAFDPLFGNQSAKSLAGKLESSHMNNFTAKGAYVS